MKIKRDYPQITVSDKASKFLKTNNWLYDGEIINTDRPCENGEIVDVVSLKGRYLGSGFYSEKSKIKVRLFSRNSSDTYDDDFFIRRVKYACKYRKDVMPELTNCRLIFGEADGLPGLTVDKFNNVLVTQIACFGTERIKDVLFQALLSAMKEEGEQIDVIYERNDVASRALEGLPEYKDYYFKAKDISETIIEENGIRYYVDFINGQKTGFFLDQKFNRKLIAEIAKDKKVLDCFTHTGSFALNAAYGKAKYVKAVDISETAIEQAKRNAQLNDLSIDFEVNDVFDYLGKVSKREYDLIILDPPAFTKSRSTIEHAFNGYKAINSLAIKALGKGGYLATCSCSHFMSRENFEKMLLEAARDNNVQLKQLSFTQQGKDHPILLSSDETNYLKFYIFQIV